MLKTSLERHAQRHALGAVDVEVQPGRVGAEAVEEPCRPGVCVALGDDAVADAFASSPRPRLPRSSIMILKPPVVPRPSIGGAPKTVDHGLANLLAAAARAGRPAIASADQPGLAPLVEFARA